MFLGIGIVIKCGSWGGSPAQLQVTSLQLCHCLLKWCEAKPTGLDGVEKGVGEVTVLLIYLAVEGDRFQSLQALLVVAPLVQPYISVFPRSSCPMRPHGCHVSATIWDLTSWFVSCFHLGEFCSVPLLCSKPFLSLYFIFLLSYELWRAAGVWE